MKEKERIEKIRKKAIFEFNWLCDVLRENGKITEHDIIIARDGVMFTIDEKEVDK